MFKNKRVVVVLPAYNAEKTLLVTYEEIRRQECVDSIILVDDASEDRTLELARTLPGVAVCGKSENRGYGSNQKTCYQLALEQGGDVVIMVHPDYQYTPKLIPAMVSLIGNDLYQCVIGSRILGGRAMEGGMPLWRYVSNRTLTFVQNLALGAKLSEYHTGYRAFSRKLLERLPLDLNSDDFLFDNQMLCQVIWTGCVVAEISCPTRYFKEASSIDFGKSVRYGFGCVATSLEFAAAKSGLVESKRFPPETREFLASSLASPDPLTD